MEEITIKEEPELLNAIKKNGNDVTIRKGHQKFGCINSQTLQARYWEIEIPEQDFYNSFDIWNNNYILKQKKSQFVKWQDEEEKEKAIQMAKKNNKPKYYVSATSPKRIIKEIEYFPLKNPEPVQNIAKYEPQNTESNCKNEIDACMHWFLKNNGIEPAGMLAFPSIGGILTDSKTSYGYKWISDTNGKVNIRIYNKKELCQIFTKKNNVEKDLSCCGNDLWKVK